MGAAIPTQTHFALVQYTATNVDKCQVFLSDKRVSVFCLYDDETPAPYCGWKAQKLAVYNQSDLSGWTFQLRLGRISL